MVAAWDLGERALLMAKDGHDVLIGRMAHVITSIPGGGEPGEVMIRVRGGTEAYIAYASEPLERGTEVVVVADRGARSVEVTPLNFQ
jgi:membrane protein implicated in regulation of membrane protease activity